VYDLEKNTTRTCFSDDGFILPIKKRGLTCRGETAEKKILHHWRNRLYWDKTYLLEQQILSGQIQLQSNTCYYHDSLWGF
jgi:hypothetical protein